LTQPLIDEKIDKLSSNLKETKAGWEEAKEQIKELTEKLSGISSKHDSKIRELEIQIENQEEESELKRKLIVDKKNKLQV